MARAPRNIVIVGLIASACSLERAPVRTWSLADSGAGPVVVGMSFDEANRASGGALKLSQPLPAEGCTYAWGPDSVAFMIENGRLVRLEVRAPGVATSEGARVGDTEARIEQLYAGRVTRMPHKYTQGAYLTVAPRETARGTTQLIFETDGQRVTQFRGGLMPQVTYVEGCG